MTLSQQRIELRAAKSQAVNTLRGAVARVAPDEMIEVLSKDVAASSLELYRFEELARLGVLVGDWF